MCERARGRIHLRHSFAHRSPLFVRNIQFRDWAHLQCIIIITFIAFIHPCFHFTMISSSAVKGHKTNILSRDDGRFDSISIRFFSHAPDFISQTKVQIAQKKKQRSVEQNYSPTQKGRRKKNRRWKMVVLRAHKRN